MKGHYRQYAKMTENSTEWTKIMCLKTPQFVMYHMTPDDANQNSHWIVLYDYSNVQNL